MQFFSVTFEESSLEVLIYIHHCTLDISLNIRILEYTNNFRLYRTD